MASLDPRQDAFDALLPLAVPTADALDRVDQAVEDERRMAQPRRKAWTPTQHAAAQGLARFNYGVGEVGAAWEQHDNVARVSSPSQELGQIFLWSRGDSHILRIKHDPVEGVAPGTQSLFAQEELTEQPLQVFLTWTVSKAGNIARPAFVCVEHAPFTIPLSQLLERASAEVASVTSRRPSPKVHSTRKKRDEKHDES